MASLGFECEKEKATQKGKEAKDINELPDGVNTLKLRQLIGFNGSVRKGLLVHALGEHVIYAVGKNIIVEELPMKDRRVRQDILSGHSDLVTCIAQCEDGRFLASGQTITPGWKAPVILWHFETRAKVMDFPLHKVHVEGIEFNFTGELFATVGGAEDRQFCVWCVGTREPICGKPAQLVRAGTTRLVAASKKNPNVFVTAGDNTGRIWTVNSMEKQMESIELNFSACHRDIKCLEIADRDNMQCPMVFCGSASGDILICHMNTGLLQCVIPTKNTYSLGITALTYVRMLDDHTFHMIMGTGEGHVGSINIHFTFTPREVHAKLNISKNTQIWKDGGDSVGAITSIGKVGPGQTLYVGSEGGNIYQFNLFSMKPQLIRTTSRHPINAITFARGTDDLMLVAGYEQIRIYNLQVGLEVRRYSRTCRTCNAVKVNHDGTEVYTGWDDGTVIVLGFYHKDFTLKELYRVECVQKQAVLCLALTNQPAYMVSGGKDGMTRVWKLVNDLDMRGQRLRQALLVHTLADQHAPITSLQVSKNDHHVLATSADGSAVIYDLVDGYRHCSINADAHINFGRFCCNELQLVLVSQGGYVDMFEILLGSGVRNFRGTTFGSTNCVAVDDEKGIFITGADDALVKVWNVESGEMTHMGFAHSQKVTFIEVGPCSTVLVSGSQDGSVCVWEMPTK